MLKEQKYKLILELLESQEHLTVDDVVELIQASRSTVCRYFSDLSHKGLVIRSHGGISLLKRSDLRSLPYELRHSQNNQEKKMLAREAVTLLRERDTVFLDGGTTTHHIASNMPSISLTVVTNALPHASTLIENQSREVPIEVFITGGYVFAPWHVNIGPQTQYCLSQYHANWAFISAKGIDETGIYNHNEMIVESERTMIANADKVVLLADHTKFGERSIFFVSAFENIDYLITIECPENKKLLNNIKEQGVEIIKVSRNTIQQ